MEIIRDKSIVSVTIKSLDVGDTFRYPDDDYSIYMVCDGGRYICLNDCTFHTCSIHDEVYRLKCKILVED